MLKNKDIKKISELTKGFTPGCPETDYMQTNNKCVTSVNKKLTDT